MNQYSMKSIATCMLLFIILGYGLRKANILKESLMHFLIQVCYYVLLPLFMFSKLTHTSLEYAPSVKLIVFCIMCALLVFVLLLVIIPMLELEDKYRTVMIKSLISSNFLFLGLPLICSNYSKTEVDLIMILIALYIPVYTLLFKILYYIYSPTENSLKHTFLETLTHPLCVASFLGLSVMIFDVNILQSVTKHTKSFEGIGIILSLILLGGRFEFNGLKEQWRQLKISVFIKLFVFPAVFTLIFIGHDFKGVELAAGMLLFICPTETLFTKTKLICTTEQQLTNQIMTVTTIVSIISFWIWIMVMNMFGSFN